MIKKFFCGLGAAFLILGTMTLSVNAENIREEIHEGDMVCVIEDNNIAHVEKNGNVIVSMLYENGYRCEKEGVVHSTYVYEDGFLVQENRDNFIIEYDVQFVEEIDNLGYHGFCINGKNYQYLWNDQGLITGIIDEIGIQVALYVYDGIELEAVMEMQDGQWIKTDSQDFIGNYNKIRCYGDYYDDETGWYYTGSIYHDVIQGKVIGLEENDEYLTEENPFISEYNEGIMLLGYEADDYAAEMWAEELLSNSTFNAAKNSGWHLNSSASTVSIIARALYGENTSNLTDQRAMSWIILNRYYAQSSEFGFGIREIVAKPYQFDGLYANVSLKAKSSTDQGWRHAVYLACLMCTNSDAACWNSVSQKPLGISNQRYFRSANTLGSTSQIYEENGQLYAHYNTKNVAISNACIAGKGVSTTVAGLRALCESDVSKYNVFFYHGN